MFEKEIRLLLKGELPASSSLTGYLATIAKARLVDSGLHVDVYLEVEDAVQGFLLYLIGTWYPRHKASVECRTDKELAAWVVNAYHRWLTGEIETKRAVPRAQPLREERTMIEGDDEIVTPGPAVSRIQLTIPVERQPEVLSAREKFERFFHDHESSAVEWARREETGRWWRVWRVVEKAIQGNYSAEQVFEIVVRVLILLDNPKAPAEKDLAFAHFRAFLALKDEFSQAELAETLGIERNTDYHAKLEKEWPAMKETAEGELEIRGLIEQVDPDMIREDIEKRFDNVLRKRVGAGQLEKEEVERRTRDKMDLEAERKADPENKDVF